MAQGNPMAQPNRTFFTCPAVVVVILLVVGMPPHHSVAQVTPGKSETKKQDPANELDPEYLKKWTPIRRTESRFPYEDETDADWTDDRFQKMDTGPTFCSSIKTPKLGMTPKAIAIRLGERAAVLFDTQQLNIKASWTGDYLELPPNRFGMLQLPSVKGNVQFDVGRENTWSWKENNDQTITADTNNSRFEKQTLSGNDVLLNYRVGQTLVSEWNSIVPAKEQTWFRRTITLSKGNPELSLPIVLQNAKTFRWLDDSIQKDAIIRQGNTNWLVHLDSNRVFLKHEIVDAKKNTHRISLVFPHAESGQTADLLISSCQTDSLDQARRHFDQLQPLRQFPNFTQPTPRWGKPLATQGKTAPNDSPLVVDEIRIPHDNPYNALFYTSGIDFLPDGTAVICTIHGDVWTVKGINKDLNHLTWQRFATGLYQPLGLKIVDGSIYVLGRDRITILKDINFDGEADEYINFCDLLQVTGQAHAYAMSLETDSEGNFYFIKSGGSAPHGGTMVQITPEGNNIEVFSTGYRHANGMGIGPNDEITSADNEGNWTPTTRIDLVRKGGFYGHMPTHRRKQPPGIYDGPLCWVPRLIDNSAGGQVWVTNKDWGPLFGKMIHLSFGRCTANLVLTQHVDDVDQAAIMKLDLPPFLSGVMRGRFNHHDGHLYVVGVDGWQTAAVADGCLQRVRATGQAMNIPVGFNVRSQGIEIEFPQPLDENDAATLANWDIQQWNYRWSKTYGSDHYKITNPDEVGHDVIPIESVEVSKDRRKVFLKVDNLKPVMQMQVTGKIKSAEGTLIPIQIFNTIHKVPTDK
jgi:hypothetical protein